jgi:Holliday junction resolvase RusA-like endonuclease
MNKPVKPKLTIIPHCEFGVDGKPKATPRIKSWRRGKMSGITTPDTADDWKALVAMAAQPHLPPTPLDGPIKCDITLVFPRPKRLCRKRDYPGMIPMDRKPDRDNCEKAILDMLSGIGMWTDDARVCTGPVDKWYHAIGAGPGAWIEIGTIAELLADKAEQK